MADAAHKSTFACGWSRFSQKECAMNAQNDKMTREERLAAKLRENLRRRKGQAREIRESDDHPLSKGDAGS